MVLKVDSFSPELIAELGVASGDPVNVSFAYDPAQAELLRSYTNLAYYGFTGSQNHLAISVGNLTAISGYSDISTSLNVDVNDGGLSAPVNRT